MAKFFDDIGKDSGDLLSKELPSSGAAKVTVETQNDSGVKLVATGRRFVKTKGESLVEATLEPTVDISKHNVEVKGSFSTSREYSTTVTLKDLGTKGTKFGGGVAEKGGVLTAKGDVSFKHDIASVKITGSVPVSEKRETGASVDAALVGAYEKKIFAGLQATYTLGVDDKPATFSYGAKVGFDQPEFQGHLHARTAQKEKKDQLLLSAGWFHKMSSWKLAVGATFDAKNVEGPSVQIAADYKFDDQTSLRERFTFRAFPDSSKPFEVRYALGLKQAFTKGATATFGADLTARAPLGQNRGVEHTFGVVVMYQSAAGGPPVPG
jgi:hypothetical protein